MLPVKNKGSYEPYVVSDKKTLEVFFLLKFLVSSYITLCEKFDPCLLSRKGQLLPSMHNIIHLDRRLLDDATCQIARLKALYFQTRRFLKLYRSLPNTKAAIFKSNMAET